MVHLPALIQDLCLILAAAGTVTLLFKILKQPVVLGYVLAGLLVGPHLPIFPTVTEISSIQIWAEIGVIFLLFALGLEFSFKKLARVGGAASITAVIEVISMLGLGYLTGWMFGWSGMDCLFLGGTLAISSTTIIIRAFEEIGVKGKSFASLVFGVLIVEDLVAIILLVLLSTVAVSRSFVGFEMASSVVKLGFFLTLWFVSGIFLIPSFLRKMKPLLNDETLLVVSVALCLIMVVLATHAGFSPALGAFIMGSILAETPLNEKIEKLIIPVRDLFAAVFFVSVGMLIDPKILVEYAVPVLVITIVTIVGKTLSTWIGCLLSGQSLKDSIQSGFSLAQIGEFSFIIASLGLSLKVTSDFLYPVAVGVSAITTFTTPYMVRSSDRVHQWVSHHLPKKWQEALIQYASGATHLSSDREWRQFIKGYLTKATMNAVLVTAIFLGVGKYVLPLLSSEGGDYRVTALMCFALSIILSSPFWWALVIGLSKHLFYHELWLRRKYRNQLLVMDMCRWLLIFIFFTLLSAEFVPYGWAMSLGLILCSSLLWVFSRHLSGVYHWLESRFVKNLLESNDRDPHH